MSPEEPSPQVSVGLAISELRRSVDVGFAKIDGRLDLLVQRGDQSEGRLDHHSEQLAELDERQHTLERNAVTHEHLDRRNRRYIAIAGLIIALVGIAVGVLAPIVSAGLGITE